MSHKNYIKIIELPISVLNRISGGTDKQPTPPPPPPKPEPNPKPPPKTVFTDPIFYVIWDWD